MKNYVLALAAIALCTACEQKVETPAAGTDTKESSTVVNSTEPAKETTPAPTVETTAPAPAPALESTTPAPAPATTTESTTTTTTPARARAPEKKAE